MEIKILKAQKSSKSILETELAIDGIVTENDRVSEREPAYELVVHVYAYENADIPLRTIEVENKYYIQNVNRYGMEELLKGVELTSLLSITEKVLSDLFDKEIEAISYSIVARMNKETFLNNYIPNNMREYIENKLIELKTKFKIEPK